MRRTAALVRRRAALRRAYVATSLRREIEQLFEPRRPVRADDELLEDADAAAPAERRLADRLHVQMKRQRRVDVAERPRLAADVRVADVHPVSPARMLVAEADHREVVERLERDLE